MLQQFYLQLKCITENTQKHVYFASIPQNLTDFYRFPVTDLDQNVWKLQCFASDFNTTCRHLITTNFGANLLNTLLFNLQP